MDFDISSSRPAKPGEGSQAGIEGSGDVRKPDLTVASFMVRDESCGPLCFLGFRALSLVGCKIKAKKKNAKRPIHPNRFY